MEVVPETNSEPVLSTAPSSSSQSPTAGLSAAQLRQERIRRKVLANQGERLKTVLGPSATDEDIKNLLKSQSLASTIEDVLDSPSRLGLASLETNGGTGSTGAQQVKTQPDQVPVKPPPISVSTQRYIVCLVGILLSIIVPSTTTIGWNNFVLYFTLLELIIWGFVKGGSFINTSTNNTLPITLTMFLLLVNKPGLKNHLKIAYDLWNWLWIDFCCFTTSIFIVQLVFAYFLI